MSERSIRAESVLRVASVALIEMDKISETSGDFSLSIRLDDDGLTVRVEAPGQHLEFFGLQEDVLRQIQAVVGSDRGGGR